jgi:hypothetical protein
MKPFRSSFALVASALIVLCACQKEEDPIDAVTGDACGQEGARVQATVGGSSFCANASVIAQSNGSTLMITGVSLTDGSLMLSIDSMAVGTQPITEASNGALYTGIGGSYTVAQNDSGTVTISTLDAGAHRAKGTCSVPLRLNGEGELKQLEASFDVTWTIQ